MENSKTGATAIASVREQDDPKQTAIEASSIAYMVSTQLGIDGSADTFADIAIWSKDKDAKVLLRSLDFIKKQAQEMVTDLEEYICVCTSVNGKAESMAVAINPCLAKWQGNPECVWRQSRGSYRCSL